MDYKPKVRCTNPLKNLKKYHGCLLQKVLLISNRAIWRVLFEKEYHSSVNFGADPESGLEIKKSGKTSIVDMQLVDSVNYRIAMRGELLLMTDYEQIMLDFAIVWIFLHLKVYFIQI